MQHRDPPAILAPKSLLDPVSTNALVAYFKKNELLGTFANKTNQLKQRKAC